jgi:hypothetical protein
MENDKELDELVAKEDAGLPPRQRIYPADCKEAGGICTRAYSPFKRLIGFISGIRYGDYKPREAGISTQYFNNPMEATRKMVSEDNAERAYRVDLAYRSNLSVLHAFAQADDAIKSSQTAIDAFFKEQKEQVEGKEDEIET